MVRRFSQLCAGVLAAASLHAQQPARNTAIFAPKAVEDRYTFRTLAGQQQLDNPQDLRADGTLFVADRSGNTIRVGTPR